MTRPKFLQDALVIAATAHRGQRDQGGLPYMLHPLMVAELVAHHGPLHEAAALLHDVIEDTDTTLDDLNAAGMPPEVVAAVDALTHRHWPMPGRVGGESRFFYLERIRDNEIAFVVKTEGDIVHNTDERRLSQLKPQRAQRLRDKYAADLAILNRPRE